jgi:S-adenosylmethionine-diacylglycerol 3-amino-3-carboxypropyl transferase
MLLLILRKYLLSMNMNNNKIQFSIVREDHKIESYLIEKFRLNNLLLVASGGCTTLNLSTLFPNINITAFDINPYQIRLIEKKIEIINNSEKIDQKLFNIGCINNQGLNDCGNFESLFRSLRNFINEFILSREELTILFNEDSDRSDYLLNLLITNKYWPVCFSLFFSDDILIAMFGNHAVQHAKSGTYPRYFQDKIENYLKDKTRLNNYFLHHIFLGYYISIEKSPPYISKFNKKLNNISLINNSLFNIKQIDKFNLISLSNIFDWSNDEEIKSHFKYLSDNVSNGSVIVFRQLNNVRDYSKYFEQSFKELHDDGKYLESIDNSMFYDKIRVLVKV